MKLVFAIFVLLALFTEGEGKSGVRHANHKYDALNMRKVTKTAVLHKDEAMRNSTGTAMPELPESFQFPVVVDLTEFDHRLEQRFARINGNIESLRTSLDNLKLTGLSFCQTGSLGCLRDCGGSEGVNKWYEQTKHYTVTFPKEFPGIPTVTAALKEIRMTTEGGYDTYGWHINAKSATSSNFLLEFELIDREIYTFYASWIACYTL